MTEENQNETFEEQNDDAQSVVTEEPSDENESNAEEIENDEKKIIEIPEDELNQLKEKANNEEEKYLRLYAEFENYKRRMKQESEITKTYKSQSVLTDILPTLDNIDRALKLEGESEEFVSLKNGVQMVYDGLLKALKDNGLEEVEAYNQPFDPNVHQAVMQDNNPDFESGIVTEELQKGFKLKERVLRPAMVKVNE